MLRIDIPERSNWKALAHELGFHFHTTDGEPYWKEDAYYQFTLARHADQYNSIQERLINAMVVGDRACSMGIREDVGRITKDSSCFVPHAIV